MENMKKNLINKFTYLNIKHITSDNIQHFIQKSMMFENIINVSSTKIVILSLYLHYILNIYIKINKTKMYNTYTHFTKKKNYLQTPRPNGPL